METEEQKNIAIRVLARTGSVFRAAKKAGVDVSTIRAWEKDPDFTARLVADKSIPVQRTLHALLECGPEAVRILREEMTLEKPTQKKRVGRPPKDEKFLKIKPIEHHEPDPRRIRAAKIVLENFRWALEGAHLTDRVKELTRLLEETQTPALPAPEDVIDVE